MLASLFMSRRKMLATVGVGCAAVALPAAVACALPAAGVDWSGLAADLSDAVADMNAAEYRLAIANRGFRTWEKRNPFPVKADEEGDRAAVSAWVRRYENARTQCGAGAWRRELAACEQRYAAVCARVAATKCQTLDDVKAKAGVGMKDRVDGPLAISLVIELAQMAVAS